MTVQPDKRHANDAEMCWCADCIRELIKANDEYMQRWLDRHTRDDEPRQPALNTPDEQRDKS